MFSYRLITMRTFAFFFNHQLKRLIVLLILLDTQLRRIRVHWTWGFLFFALLFDQELAFEVHDN